MLSCSEESPPKKKKCAAVVAKPKKVFKVLSLLDIVSAYVANEMLYEKCIQPVTTGIFKSRWRCLDRISPPNGCHGLTMGQWEAGKRVGWYLSWHCILSVFQPEQIGCWCSCNETKTYFSMSGSIEWVGLRQMTGEYASKIVGVYPLYKDYLPGGSVIIRTCPETPIQLETKLIKCHGLHSGWHDGFEFPRDLTEVFFPAKEIPRNF